MRILDAVYSIPPIVLVLAVAAVADHSLTWALVAVSVGFVPRLPGSFVARRSSVREEIFVEASSRSAVPRKRIVFHPRAAERLSPVVVSIDHHESAIFVEATLAILGVGYPVAVRPGFMLNDAYQTIYGERMNISSGHGHCPNRARVQRRGDACGMRSP